MTILCFVLLLLGGALMVVGRRRDRVPLFVAGAVCVGIGVVGFPFALLYNAMFV